MIKNRVKIETAIPKIFLFHPKTVTITLLQRF